MTHFSAPQISLGKSRRDQHGVALIMSLIFLVLMTLVGMTGIRAITKEERMVAQSYDRTIAFQAAESALREAEILIENASRPTPAVNTACALSGAPSQVMVCGSLLTPTLSRWVDPATNWADATAVGTGTLAITPEYFVEYLGGAFPCTLNSVAADTCKRYRISARADAGGSRANVILQTIYSTFEP